MNLENVIDEKNQTVYVH